MVRRETLKMEEFLNLKILWPQLWICHMAHCHVALIINLYQETKYCWKLEKNLYIQTNEHWDRLPLVSSINPSLVFWKWREVKTLPREGKLTWTHPHIAPQYFYWEKGNHPFAPSRRLTSLLW